MGFFEYINRVLLKCYEQSPIRRLLSLFNTNVSSTATADAITSPPHLFNFTSSVVCMSLAGAVTFGPVGLVVGGIIAGLTAFGMKTLQNGTGTPLLAISQTARRLVSLFKSPNYMRLGIICAIISFICFILGDRTDIAVGGLLGELIAYETIDWLLELLEPVIPYLNTIFDILKYFHNLRSVVFGVISTLTGYITYEREKVHQKLTGTYEKMCPTVEYIVEFTKSPNFVTSLEALALFGLNGFIIYRIFKSKQVTNLKTLYALKIATIALGICIGVDSIILGIAYKETVREVVQELHQKLAELLHLDELEKSPNVVLGTEIVALLCLNTFVMCWVYQWMQTTNLVILRDFDSSIIGIGICLGVDAFVIGIVKRNMLWQLIRRTPELCQLIAKYFVSFVKSKFFAVGAVVYINIALFCMLYHFSDEIGHNCNLFFGSCYHRAQITLNQIRQSMLKIKNDLVMMIETIYLNATFILGELYEQHHENPVVISVLSKLNSPHFMKSALVCTGLGIIGLLLLGLKGIIIGLISVGLFYFAISQLPRGSTAVGDAICEKFGLQPNRTHSFNIFGSVYKLKLPQEDVSNIEQWEEHKKSEICQSLLSFVLNDMKYKVSGMHVELRRSNDPQQYPIVEPLASSIHDRDNGEAVTEAEIFHPDNCISEVETADSSQQTDNHGDYKPPGSENTNKPVHKSEIISTVFESK